MKIEFTTTEMHTLLQESALFREKMIALLGNTSLDSYRDKVRTKFPFFDSSQKIDAIKWIREETKNKIDNFVNEGYEVYEQFDYSNNAKVWKLGLAAAKSFVESCSL